MTHKPPKLGTDRGPIIGAYAVAETKDGERSLEVMDKVAVEKVRAASRSKDSGPWVQWWDEMARKTVLRRLSKRLPLSEELERVIERDNALYDMEARRQAVTGGTVQTTAAHQLAAFSSAPALEHDGGTASDAWEPPQQTYALVTLDGEVKEFTSSAEWLTRFEAALKGCADPARLWDLNADAAEWAADMTEGGDDTLARLRKAYLTKPEVEPAKPEQAAQPDTSSAAQTDDAVPAGDEWADELTELKRIGSTCQDYKQWTVFVEDHAGRIDALVAANGGAYAGSWQEFAKEQIATFQQKGKK